MNMTHTHTTPAAAARDNAMRLANYRDAMRFDNGDEKGCVWITSDAAAHPAAHYLLECAVYREGVCSMPLGLIMAPSGFRKLLTAAPGDMLPPFLPLNHVPQWSDANELALPDARRVAWLTQGFLSFEREHVGSRSYGNLHVAGHPMVRWQADEEWGDDEYLFCPLMANGDFPPTPNLSEHEFIEKAVIDNFDGAPVVISRDKAFLKRLAILACERYGDDGYAFIPKYLDDKGFLVDVDECGCENPEIVAAIARGEARRETTELKHPNSGAPRGLAMLRSRAEFAQKDKQLINCYRDVVILEGSEDDYSNGVWLTSDAALHPAAHYLLDMAVFKRGVFSKERGIIMTPSGFECFCAAATPELDGLRMLQPNYSPTSTSHPADALNLNLTAEQKAGYLVRNFLRFERQHEHSRSFGNLHVAKHPDVEWVADAEEWGKHSLTCRTPRAGYPDFTERQFLEEIVRKLNGIQVVISRDKELLQHLAKLAFRLHGDDGSSLWLRYLNDDGLLVWPEGCAEEDLPEEAACGNQAAVLRTHCVCIDESALHHRHAAKFLRDAAPVLREAGTQLHVLAPENSALRVTSLLHEGTLDEPPTVSFAEAGSSSSKVTNLLNALLKEKAAMPEKKLILVTDNVLRAEAVQKRLEEQRVELDVYSISRYGYLTLRARTNNSSYEISDEERKARAEAACKSMKEALATHNVEKVRNLASNENALTFGIRAALVADDEAMLGEMLHAATRIPSFAMRWWLLESKMFRAPAHLAENPMYYHSLVRALPKVEFPRTLAAKIHRNLLKMVQAKGGAQTELNFLARLFEEALVEADDGAVAICIKPSQLPAELPHSHSPQLVQLYRKRQRQLSGLKRITFELDAVKTALQLLQKKQEEAERSLAELEAEIAKNGGAPGAAPEQSQN